MSCVSNRPVPHIQAVTVMLNITLAQMADSEQAAIRARATGLAVPLMGYVAETRPLIEQALEKIRACVEHPETPEKQLQVPGDNPTDNPIPGGTDAATKPS